MKFLENWKFLVENYFKITTWRRSKFFCAINFESNTPSNLRQSLSIFKSAVPKKLILDTIHSIYFLFFLQKKNMFFLRDNWLSAPLGNKPYTWITIIKLEYCFLNGCRSFFAKTILTKFHRVKRIKYEVLETNCNKLILLLSSSRIYSRENVFFPFLIDLIRVSYIFSFPHRSESILQQLEKP